MCQCAFCPNPESGLSYYEDDYLKMIEPYKVAGTLKYFPELLAEMVAYIEENRDSSQGNDLLGEFFQQELSRGRSGQFFTPFHICQMMAEITRAEETKPSTVLDPCCGSGRMLLAFGKNAKMPHCYYGVDIDPVCTKMAAINLFLNGLQGEVICADALLPDDFRLGYRISFQPLGIFKVERKEDSMVWQINQNSFLKNGKNESEKILQGQLQLF